MEELYLSLTSISAQLTDIIIKDIYSRFEYKTPSEIV